MSNIRSNTSFSLLALLLFAAPLHAEIYKWVDSNGSVHFSDKPREGAETVSLPPAQTYSPPSVPENKPESLQPEAKSTSAHQSTYTKVFIVEPKDQATIRSNQNLLSVLAQVEPELNQDDQLQLLYDGKLMGKPQKELVFSLENIYRGAHSLQIQIVSPDGSIIKSSDPITIYMHHTRVGGGN